VPVTPPVPDTILDLSDASCPHLLIAVITAMRSLDVHQILKVIATDLAAPSHITAWTRQSGQKLLDLYEENGRFIFWLQRVPVAGWAGSTSSAARPDHV